jgi:hypothetical protein
MLNVMSFEPIMDSQGAYAGEHQRCVAGNLSNVMQNIHEQLSLLLFIQVSRVCFHQPAMLVQSLPSLILSNLY